MDQVVEFYEVPRVEYADAIEPHAYRFRETGKQGRKGKQRRAFGYLRRTGALRQVIKPVAIGSITRYRIVPEDFMGLLLRQRSDLFRDFNLEGRTLLIGSVDFAEMMGGPQMRQAVHFEAEYNTQDRFGTKVAGLTVRVIPWMRGILVMP